MGTWGLVLGLLTGYIVGGLTFVPLLAWTLWAWGTRDASHREADETLHDASVFSDKEDVGKLDGWGAGLGEDLLRELKAKQHIPDVASGYFAICREYVPGGINGKPPERTNAVGIAAGVESPSVYQTMYRSFFERSKTPGPSINAPQGKNKKVRNVFYVVLRLGTLMLYDDVEQIEVRHVISLSHYNVAVYAGGEDIPEGELWIKRNCIRLAPRESVSAVGDPRSFYLFSDNCSEKEDFYHAMLRSQESHAELSPGPPPPLKFNPTDLIKLVQQLHASEENLHTRWINALIGRLFLAMYKTKEIEQFIWTKITKKIARVQKPSLISSIKVQRLDMGHLPPFLTNPKLKELTVDGDLTVEADVSYKGNFRIDISAVARIELGSRFKPREVTLVLATILKGLEGHVLIRIKPPPSNRLWVTFETPPKMDLSLEPIVSSRQITYGVILRAIESRIREVVNETLVLPNWDDMPFSSTLSSQFREGLWRDDVEVPDDAHERSIVTDRQAPPEDPHAEATSSSIDASKSTPALGSHTLHKRKPVPPELNSESGDLFSSFDQSPLPRPRAMRSGSYLYANAASPMINADSAIFQGDEQEENDSAASSIRTTTARSPPSSPASPAFTQPRHPRRKTSLPTHTAEMAKSNQSFDDILSGIPSPKSPSRSMDATNDAQVKGTYGPSIPDRSADTSKERRSTLNQFNSATTAAKKWLAARQNPNSSEATGKMHTSEGESIASFDGTNNGHQTGPIGRGQPLPPPGTPLPLPPRADKKTWSVPSASTLVNLARRNPLSAKGSTFPSDPAAPLPSDDRNVGLQDAAFDAKSLGENTPPTPPPPLPKRRQRASTRESFSKAPKEEEILVVEAPPDQEVSAPSSPVAKRELALSAVKVDEGAHVHQD
ncbi:hypothetical protein N0V90_012862 [Kalmusia sp. IMI 367209]|nr:hypothetical protein N0V90_012862 [Kalmusia sp. IMI 367209]